MPDEVVARMNDVLAGLHDSPAVAEKPADGNRGATVVPLAPHRRRRAAGLLVAAAAIVVGGIVAAQNLQTSSRSETTSAGSSGDLADDSTSAARTPGPEFFSGSSARGSTVPKAVLKGGRLVVHPRRFSADALAGQRLIRHKPATALAQEGVTCVTGPTGSGEVLRATYQGAPAALVYRPASGGSQVVDLFVCGSRLPVRSATLPAP